MPKRKAIYPGSFDPVTNGHLDLIKRAAVLFDVIYVVVSSNRIKNSLFTIDERVQMVKRSVSGLKNVRVDSFDGLTVKYALSKKAFTLIRGLRAISDFDYEFQMALTNRTLAAKVDTVFILPSESNFYLSSRVVKEIAMFGGDVSGFVPKFVAQKLKRKIARGS